MEPVLTPAAAAATVAEQPAPPSLSVVRPEVAAFALAMERKLAANDAKKGKRGWKDHNPHDLLRRVSEEAVEVLHALKDRDLGCGDDVAILNECADVANMAMMVADAAGVLPLSPLAPVLTSQPAPTPATGDLWAELIATEPPGPIRDLMAARREQGIAKYGMPLQRGNGRDFVADAVQEALDGMVCAHGAGALRAMYGFRGALQWLIGEESPSINELRAIAAEKERDEARALLSMAIADRDGARKALLDVTAAVRDTFEALVAAGATEGVTLVERVLTLQQQRGDAQNDADAAEKERDEARAELADRLNDIDAWKGRAEQLEADLESARLDAHNARAENVRSKMDARRLTLAIKALRRLVAETDDLAALDLVDLVADMVGVERG